MSTYYSRFGLNTYRDTPYFSANIPEGYNLSAVLAKSRAFRRLPENLKKLARLSKQWAVHNGVQDSLINQYYDDDGYELDPGTGDRLTDEEINAQWDDSPILDKFKVKDIPIPDGGFPDPETWTEPPARASDPDEDADTMSEEEHAAARAEEEERESARLASIK